MALGMKRWLAVMAACLALVAVWALPPRPSGSPYDNSAVVPTPMKDQLNKLKRERRQADEALIRRGWADSLSERLVTHAVNGLDVAAPPNIDKADVAEFRANMQEALDALGPDRADMDIGVYVQPLSFGSRLRDAYYWSSNEIYAGERDGQAYCMVLRLSWRPSKTDLHKSDYMRIGNVRRPMSPLLQCRLYALYGLPGEHISRWFRHGGSELGQLNASGDAVSFADRESDGVVWVGTRGRLGRGSSVEFERCLTGQTAACGRLFEEPMEYADGSGDGPFIYANSPVVAGTGVAALDNPLGGYGELILSDLENEFGHDAFRRFWTSQKDVSVAFTDAFGVTPGEWLSRWTDLEYGRRAAGPRLPLSAWLGALLTMIACAGVTSATVMLYRRAT